MSLNHLDTCCCCGQFWDVDYLFFGYCILCLNREDKDKAFLVKEESHG